MNIYLGTHFDKRFEERKKRIVIIFCVIKAIMMKHVFSRFILHSHLDHHKYKLVSNERNLKKNSSVIVDDDKVSR